MITSSLRSVRNTLCTLLLLFPVLNFTETAAQQLPSFYGNYNIDKAGITFSVNSPASIAANLEFTLATDKGWGGAVTTPYLNVQLIKADDFFACTPLSNGTGSIPSLTGKFALIQRGNCDLSVKAYEAQSAGAAGAIIINDVPGAPIAMVPGSMASAVTIPVLMVSQDAGNTINNAIASQSVTITLTPWSNGAANDIGIINGGMAQWHACVMPKSFLSPASGPYQGITTGILANFGTTTMTNVKLKSEVTFTPTAAPPTVVHKDSVTLASFSAADSIRGFVSPNNYSVASTTTGKYDVTYTVTTDQADGNLINNTKTTSFYISDSILSKGRYDIVNRVPIISEYYGFQNSNYSVFGPLYYIPKGDHVIESVQFSVSSDTTKDLSVFGSVGISVIKWEDGLVTKDSIIEKKELRGLSLNAKTFVKGDTSGQIFTVPITDGYNNPLKVEGGYWYWVVASLKPGLLLGCDGGDDYNHFVRSWGRSQQGGYREYYAAIFNDQYHWLFPYWQNSPEIPWMLPFESTNFINTANFARQKKNITPAMPLRIIPSLTIEANYGYVCYDSSADGRIIVNVQNGTPPYSYQLNGGTLQTSDTFSNLVPGDYNITVTDANQIKGYLQRTVYVYTFEMDPGKSVAITEGQSVKLGGNPTALGNNPHTYIWTPAAGLDSATAENPIATPTTTTTYTVQATNRWGCIKSDSVTITVFPLSITNTSKDIRAKAYPNPANTVLNIHAEVAKNGHYELQLTNSTGVVLYKEPIEIADHKLQKQLKLSQYPDGIYFINIKNSKSQTVIKVEKLTPTR